MNLVSDIGIAAPGGDPTLQPAATPGPSPLPRRTARLASSAVVGVLAAAIWVSAHIHVHVNPVLHRAALFVHLISLVIGFGAVLTVDWFGLMWLLRRRPLQQVLAVADGAHLLIWLGLAGLVASGALLHPDLTSPLTLAKLALVLLVALNGVHAWAVNRRAAAYPANLPRRLLARTVLVVLISQVGWWGATVIGFLNSRP
ncbi:hypothetical protein EV384_1446 [Micromonospora kangleipakensis]|uniref:Uncharacterized protein n=1 Tax=Micromonospora kangleipakensis TaxID=1077942 RepID=A0A4Q8B608_9ACTN|nr:hypothetical protein EV384_1446 [Micromonospora kangleipakensis]